MFPLCQWDEFSRWTLSRVWDTPAIPDVDLWKLSRRITNSARICQLLTSVFKFFDSVLLRWPSICILCSMYSRVLFCKLGDSMRPLSSRYVRAVMGFHVLSDLSARDVERFIRLFRFQQLCAVYGRDVQSVSRAIRQYMSTVQPGELQ